ncbi:HNH endonuclease signature motif containing protein [Oryzobacter terrae]|uniref:HNH endonuclease signature motif containing protein n=1 Tax=Oryzobacter terrae TaxID=1620385 RepID=UPI003671A006
MQPAIPSLSQVREAHPDELAVLLSTLGVDDVRAMGREPLDAVVVATQKVASWLHAVQAASLDRFAELAADDLEVHLGQRRAERADRGAIERATSARVVPVPEPDAIAASSLAPLLNISPRTMRTRLNRARVLVELPRTFDAALAGVLEPWRVEGVVGAARDVSPERVAEFEARLDDRDVSALPKPRLVARAQRAAAKADPDGAQRARTVAPRRRGLRWAPSEVPGLMRWTADLPDETSRSLAASVDALAQEYLSADAHRRARGTGPAGPRLTVEAARADALADLAMANARVQAVVQLVLPAATAAVPTLVARRARRDVIRDALDATSDEVLVDLVAGAVTHDTLAGGEAERAVGLVLGEHLEVDGNPFLSRTRSGAGHRAGDPPRGADGAVGGWVEARGGAVVEDRVWFVDGLVEARGTTGLLPAQVTARLEHPDTRVRITGGPPGSADGPPERRRTYRPGRALAARVRARDGQCRFPGCSVPAARCDLDHVIAHPVGETVEANLHSLCRAHHGFKHHAGWTVAMTDGGEFTWTAPTGRTHTTTPASARELAA